MSLMLDTHRLRALPFEVGSQHYFVLKKHSMVDKSRFQIALPALLHPYNIVNHISIKIREHAGECPTIFWSARAFN